QIASRSSEAGFNGPNRNPQDICDFVVGESLDITQHNDRSMIFRESPESLLNRSLLFFRLQNLFGRRARTRNAVAWPRSIAVRLVVKGSGRESVSPFPPPQGVKNLGKRDSEDPSSKSRSALETADISKNLQEYFLNSIRGLRRISKH